MNIDLREGSWMARESVRIVTPAAPGRYPPREGRLRGLQHAHRTRPGAPLGCADYATVTRCSFASFATTSVTCLNPVSSRKLGFRP